jgi:hypothetical protein
MIVASAFFIAASFNAFASTIACSSKDDINKNSYRNSFSN